MHMAGHLWLEGEAEVGEGQDALTAFLSENLDCTLQDHLTPVLAGLLFALKHIYFVSSEFYMAVSHNLDR